jgi:hypothetical protein
MTNLNKIKKNVREHATRIYSFINAFASHRCIRVILMTYKAEKMILLFVAAAESLRMFCHVNYSQV